jgi:hypothetical protein
MLEIGKVYRLSRKEKSPDVIEVDGLPNFFYETAIPHANTQFEVQRGIHVFAKVKGPDGKERIPMIFITSSPYKAGSEDTPWKDDFDPDNGRIKYYGDNKSADKEPEDAAGNRALLSLMQVFRSSDSDIRAKEGVPLLYFERVTVDGRVKGNLKFQGFGIATGAELVTQFTLNKNSGKKNYFSNYQYNFVVFSLNKEQEKFDFVKWIGARYDTSLTAEETNQYAPQSWKDWIGAGAGNLIKVRREVPGQKIIRYSDQLPDSGSADFKLLTEIYEYYTSNMKLSNFEALSMEVTRKVIEENEASCMPGWILPKSDKYEKNFMMRMDVGHDALSGIHFPILGYANCVRPTQMVDNKDVESTLSKLNPGWVAAFVSMSFFSESIQEKVYSEGLPVMMINGKKIVQIVKDELFVTKFTLEEYLEQLEENYKVENKAPQEIVEV